VGERKTFVGRTLLVDISSHGLGMSMDVALLPGTKIVMRNRYADYKGIVRNCVKVDACYRIGVERIDQEAGGPTQP
jgi:hypothetical protein